MGELEDAVADAVFEKFNLLPKNCKPGVDGRGIVNWVPLSGIVIALDDGRFECVAIATGMKCLPAAQVSRAKGIVLHDSHAEVLAIRLFNLFLLQECQALLKSGVPSPYVRKREEPKVTSGSFQPFTLREGLSIHMYCSEAPCGDASMELIMRAQEDATPWPVSESLSGEAVASPLKGRGFFSKLGVVRCKPGRADSPETLSKSCSDKLALKQATSLLSSLTSALISPENAYLESLTLPETEYVSEACERSFAAKGRLGTVAHSVWQGGYAFRPFEVKTTTREFAFSRRQPCDPDAIPKTSNMSVLWTPRVQQVVVSGVLQGRKRTDIRGASAASRLNIWKTMMATLSLSKSVFAKIEPVAAAKTYGEAKRSKQLEGRREVKQTVLEEGLTGWIPNVVDDFPLQRVENG